MDITDSSELEQRIGLGRGPRVDGFEVCPGKAGRLSGSGCDRSRRQGIEEIFMVGRMEELVPGRKGGSVPRRCERRTH